MANINESNGEKSGIYYDGIVFGITKERAIELNEQYNAYVLGCTVEECDNMQRDHEREYNESHKNEKSKKRRFWGKSFKYPH